MINVSLFVPANVTAVIGTHIVRSFAYDTTFIDFEDLSPENTTHSSVQGDTMVVYNYNGNLVMHLAITQDSISNNYFTELTLKMKTGIIPGLPIIVTDIASGSQVSCEFGFIQQRALPTFATTPQNRIWSFTMPNSTIITNGITRS